eukprot:231191-Chlamydomonas_euryale.AAC.7
MGDRALHVGQPGPYWPCRKHVFMACSYAMSPSFILSWALRLPRAPWRACGMPAPTACCGAVVLHVPREGHAGWHTSLTLLYLFVIFAVLHDLCCLVAPRNCFSIPRALGWLGVA